MAPPVGATAPNAVHATYMQAQDSANPPFDAHAPSSSNGTYMPAQDGTYMPAQDPNNLALVASNNQPNTSYSLEEPPAPKPAMSMYNTVPEPSVDDLTACMNKLVNFDDVSKPVKSSTQAQPDKNQSLQSLKWAMSNSGRAPTLSEIQSMKSSASSTLVMNNPQFYNQSQQQTPYTYASAYWNVFECCWCCFIRLHLCKFRFRYLGSILELNILRRAVSFSFRLLKLCFWIVCKV